MKRKLFVIPLIVALLITCMIPTFAAGETTNNGVAVTNGAGAPGSEVRMRVSIRSAMVDYVGLQITYDEKLTLVVDDNDDDIDDGSRWLMEAALSDVNAEKGVAVWAGEYQEIKGDIFELVFRISEEASVDDVLNVSCTVLAKNGNEKELEQGATASVMVKNLAKISGTVTSYGTETDPVTVELLNGDAIVKSQTLENGETAYEFEVEADVYTIRVKKTKHCPREYEVDMTKLEDAVQDAEIRLYGDVNGDGEISTGDAMQILNHINGNDSIITDPYIKEVIDTIKDGEISTGDVMQILNYINGNASVFDDFI